MDEIEQKLDLGKENQGGEGEGKKPELTLEQIKGIKTRNFHKLAKELGIELPKAEEEQKIENKKTEKKGFDLSEKAYLKTSEVPKEDFDFIFELVQSTGKELDEVLETKWVQSELKERAEARKVEDAIPSGSKRSASSSRDSVEYWIAKGGLPDNPELARQVVNARLKKEVDGNVFSSNPVVK